MIRINENVPRSVGRRSDDKLREQMAKANEKFLLWLILGAVSLSAVMFSAGYYVASKEAAHIVLENEKAYQRGAR